MPSVTLDIVGEEIIWDIVQDQTNATILLEMGISQDDLKAIQDDKAATIHPHWHPTQCFHPNHLNALLISKYLHRYGPVRGWWMFLFERVIGNLQQSNMNNKLDSNRCPDLYVMVELTIKRQNRKNNVFGVLGQVDHACNYSTFKYSGWVERECCNPRKIIQQ
jgi:hypothetical protein